MMPHTDFLQLPTVDDGDMMSPSMKRASRYIDFTATGSDAIENSRGRIAQLTSFDAVSAAAQQVEPSDGFCIIMHKLTHPSQPHYHDYVEITHVLDGNVLMHVESDTTTVAMGGTMVVKPGARHLISPLITSQPPVEIDLIISRALLHDFFAHIPDSGNPTLRGWLADDSTAPAFVYIPPGRMPSANTAIERLIYAYCASPQYRTDFATTGALLECLSHIDEALQWTPQGDPLVSNIMEAITANLRNVSIDSLAQQMGYSAGYLSRYVKAHCGKTIGQLITEERMNRAATLLQSTDDTISDIAHAIGYESASFCT